MNYEKFVLEFIFSLRWLWIIVLFMLYYLVKHIINYMRNKNSIESDITIRDTKYNEDDIVGHLDYIINEAIDEYILLNIRPKNIFYINSKIEGEIIDHLIVEVPKRLSKTLLTNLSFIYNDDYIGEYIGKHIYIVVINYTLTYNFDNASNENNTNKKI